MCIRRSAAGRITAADKGLEPPSELMTGKQDAATTRVALQADVGAQSHHVPVVAATRVRLAQSHYIAKSNFYGHAHTMGLDSGPGQHRLLMIVTQPRAGRNFV